MLPEHRLLEFRLHLRRMQARKHLEPRQHIALHLWQRRLGRPEGLKIQQLTFEHKRLALRPHRHTSIVDFQQPHLDVHLFGRVVDVQDQVRDQVLGPVIKLHIKVPAGRHIAVEAAATRWRGRVLPNDTAGATRKVRGGRLGTVAIIVGVASSAIRRGTASIIRWGCGRRPALAPPLAHTGSNP